jgi:hypothetical protein
MDEIQTKVLRVFLLTIKSHLYSNVLRVLFLQITQPYLHITYSFYWALL